MLTPEQAVARLSEWRLPDGDNRLEQGAKKLSAELKKVAEVAFGFGDQKPPEHNQDWHQSWHWRQQRIEKLGKQLIQLSAAERAKLFAIVAPKLAPALEVAMQLLIAAPYQMGYNRKAFRAPTRPELASTALGAWLISLSDVLMNYRAEILTPVWLATWGAHLGAGHQTYGVQIGSVLAAALHASDAEADEVFEVLRLSLINQHEIGAMGRHVSTALLLANRPQGWELIEKTLLAAQRQEGLRQAILESIDETHPEAFRRMLRLILDHDLIRFSSVTRAVDVWFGQLWSVATPGVIKKMLAQIVEYLEDPAAHAKALKSKDAETVFLALWRQATEDSLASVPIAQEVLSSKSVELRYVAARHLANLGLPEAHAALTKALSDEDPRVAAIALVTAINDDDWEAKLPLKQDDRFERIEQFVARLPAKPLALKPLVWPWTAITLKRTDVAARLGAVLGSRPATRLIPYLPSLDPNGRRWVASTITERKPWDQVTRGVIFELMGDSSEPVREVALTALKDVQLTAQEAEQLEGLLTRKTGDLRRGLLALLLKMDDAAALASASRLLASKDANQRLAGLELVRLLTEAARSTAECRALVEEFQAKKTKLTAQELQHIQETFKEPEATVTLADALGLMNPAERTKPSAPRDLRTPLVTPAAIACLVSLDNLIYAHRESEIQIESYGGPRTELLGNLSWGFPSPDLEKPPAPQMAKLPLADIWLKWFHDRGPECRDPDGFELVRALIWCPHCAASEFEEITEWAKENAGRQKLIKHMVASQSRPKLRFTRILDDVLEWLLFLSPVDATDFLLDAVETVHALTPSVDLHALSEPVDESRRRNPYMYNADDSDCRRATAYEMWENAVARCARLSQRTPTPEQSVRYWRLMHSRDEPFPGARRRRADPDLLLYAYSLGSATIDDVADHLLGPRGWGTYTEESFHLLGHFTSRRPSTESARWLDTHPEVRALIDRATARILDLELGRGDTATEAVGPAHAISSITGLETLRRILAALGKDEFKTVASWRRGDQHDRRQTLTRLARVTFPGENDTPEDFARVMKQAVREKQIPEERLLQLTFLAPQWSKSVEAYFAWPNMTEGVYWFLAHMSYVGGLTDNVGIDDGAEDEGASQEPASTEATSDDAAESTDPTAEAAPDDENPPAQPKRKLSAWERLILERTPLTDHERREGAIDVAWFRRTHEQLGERRWQSLAEAARFAANPAQAKRAKFIGEVLLNKVSRRTLIEGIKKKQLKEYVRLFGLLPLAKGDKREKDLAERCRVLREYRRYANQLSGLTKPAALLSWQIGMKNLAQTAGFADPLRLEWSVGADELKDLAAGPVIINKDGVTVTLALDEFSKPSITASKNGKQLKSIPPALKKDKKVAALVARVTDIKRQASSIRQSLEAAMCRGDRFSGQELQSWCSHALLAPLLARLVIVGEGILGYPDKKGKALRDCEGKLEPIKAKESLRLAHPHDLLQSGAWHDWQRECFAVERVQPFKQVFRELYVLTKQEKKDGAISHRYDAQQIQPKQALALFGNRGWNTGEGIFKVFHDEGLTAEVHFQSGVLTPLEVEGATLAGISFRKRDEWKPIALAQVPPLIFSEVMRDLDLVVSVAHAGGVDPEASASTVEMRSALLRETCALMGLKNVRFKSSHAMIRGELAEYNVHLGSGVVHRMPGGSLCIIPVHSQHRGRLFLPFADDDPRTAEVISKVLLLARDREIQDVSILEQIRQG